MLGAAPTGGAPGVGFASAETGGEEGEASRSMRAGLGSPRSQGRKLRACQRESQPEVCEVEVFSSEEKWVRRRSWF